MGYDSSFCIFFTLFVPTLVTVIDTSQHETNDTVLELLAQNSGSLEFIVYIAETWVFEWIIHDSLL